MLHAESSLGKARPWPSRTMLHKPTTAPRHRSLADALLSEAVCTVRSSDAGSSLAPCRDIRLPLAEKTLDSAVFSQIRLVILNDPTLIITCVLPLSRNFLPNLPC